MLILIQKETPPKKFIEFKQQNPPANFDDMPSDIKAILRTSLLKEQGYLCAYCMRRINDNHNEVKIEHYKPRNDENELDYSNLLAVCTGTSTSTKKERQHCDTKKGDTVLHIDPQKIEHINQLSYSNDGTILAKDNPIFTQDLNKTLNLNDNYGYLKTNRKVALESLKKFLHKKYQGKKVPIADVSKLLNFYQNMQNGQYTEYCGILIYYLMKHWKKWS